MLPKAQCGRPFLAERANVKVVPDSENQPEVIVDPTGAAPVSNVQLGKAAIPNGQTK